MPWGLIDNMNIWISNKISFEICSLGSNWQYVSIGSDNGMAPSRWQAIVWTNADPVHRRIYAALGENELTAISQERILVTNQVLMDEITWHAVFRRVAAGNISSNMARAWASNYIHVK